MAEQEQFLDVIDRDEAERRFRRALRLDPIGNETVDLTEALGRVLAEDVLAEIDVPAYDRSNYDGYAVRAEDTYGADEQRPNKLRLSDLVLATGVEPTVSVDAGLAVMIATGGMMPRGADAVVMVEHTDVQGADLLVRRPVPPGHGISFTGSDITAGETILRRGQALTSRETGVLAAIGQSTVSVWRRPRVAIISTGNEIIAPAEPMRPAMVYDSNARILADAVREAGGEPLPLGIVADDLDELRHRLDEAIVRADVVLLSGGTSKGAGDLSYRAVRDLSEPGIVAHGVALKPGKPICLAAHRGKPIVILPGFPTSAIFTFHEFVAPVVRRLAGAAEEAPSTVEARMPLRVNSEIGRTEYLLVGLIPDDQGLAAYPMGKGSGSVTAFSAADGFVTISRHQEIVEAGHPVRVQLLGSELRLADLVVIGSHCVGLDLLLGLLQEQGFRSKFLAVGSTAGLHAARRGQCDLAGIHLMDADTGRYNTHLLGDDLQLLEGYGRRQGVVYRAGDRRFEGLNAAVAVDRVKDDATCMVVNRNQGSGTRVLIDRLLGGSRPPGYANQPRSHNAVAAAVAQGRADWGIAIKNVADRAGLGFAMLEAERYDFVMPKSRLQRPAVEAFVRLLANPDVREQLAAMGFEP